MMADQEAGLTGTGYLYFEILCMALGKFEYFYRVN